MVTNDTRQSKFPDTNITIKYSPPAQPHPHLPSGHHAQVKSPPTIQAKLNMTSLPSANKAPRSSSLLLSMNPRKALPSIHQPSLHLLILNLAHTKHQSATARTFPNALPSSKCLTTSELKTLLVPSQAMFAAVSLYNLLTFHSASSASSIYPTPPNRFLTFFVTRYNSIYKYAFGACGQGAENDVGLRIGGWMKGGGLI
ncbi:hypothetical protein AC579_578 [Pseudocercospora musae]|uniref:Uncharacterized protein n=1 Tax=Pseudocercospora musae TaxID=113226 RepID=A0A139ICN0_9PEZI|nr:hypothetical protein AC579_578 [Pseudocercospora musae]